MVSTVKGLYTENSDCGTDSEMLGLDSMNGRTTRMNGSIEQWSVMRERASFASKDLLDSVVIVYNHYNASR